ncbi:MAG: hypothetical protein K2K75_06855 [Muribaculaceae bacterium]|nr:hypothetical protein [Muribaculaceae bacterium]
MPFSKYRRSGASQYRRLRLSIGASRSIIHKSIGEAELRRIGGFASVLALRAVSSTKVSAKRSFAVSEASPQYWRFAQYHPQKRRKR